MHDLHYWPIKCFLFGQSRVSQPQYCWHLGPYHSLLWEAVLRTVGCLAVSLVFTRWMEIGPLLPSWHPKTSPIIVKCLPGWEPLSSLSSPNFSLSPFTICFILWGDEKHCCSFFKYLRKMKRHSQWLPGPPRPLGNGACILLLMGRGLSCVASKGYSGHGTCNLPRIVKEEKFHRKGRIETKLLKDE